MPGEVVAYKPGAFCQLKLSSGERIFISCAQTGIKISKLSFGGFVPTKTLAEWPVSRLESAISIFADPAQPSQHPLEAIKNKLISCASIKEVEAVCGASRTEELTPQRAEKIINEYGHALEHASPPPGGVADSTKLPHSKATIKKALTAMLLSTQDANLRRHLVEGYMALADWQEGVGPKDIGLMVSANTSPQEFLAASAALEKWRPVIEKERQVLLAELKALGIS